MILQPDAFLIMLLWDGRFAGKPSGKRYQIQDTNVFSTRWTLPTANETEHSVLNVAIKWGIRVNRYVSATSNLVFVLVLRSFSEQKKPRQMANWEVRVGVEVGGFHTLLKHTYHTLTWIPCPLILHEHPLMEQIPPVKTALPHWSCPLRNKSSDYSGKLWETL